MRSSLILAWAVLTAVPFASGQDSPGLIAEGDSLVQANRSALDAKIDKPLRAELLMVLENDQKYRRQIGELEKTYGHDAPQVRDLWKTIDQKDAEDLAKVEAILDTRGWLGPDVVGRDGNTALFLVIQHSNLKTQEKYLPLMRAAVKEKKARSQSLALLEDRVALGEGRRQTYGSQIGFDRQAEKYYVRPLDDPEKVDSRRAAVGLPPMAEYVKQWKIVWDPVAYRQQLADLEKPEPPH